MPRLTAPALFALSLLGLAALASAADKTITQKGKEFSPGTITISEGDRVTFRNNDTRAHNILIKGPGMDFNSGLQTVGKDVEVTFDDTGEYAVGCAIHPRMKATVTVTD